MSATLIFKVEKTKIFQELKVSQRDVRRFIQKKNQKKEQKIILNVFKCVFFSFIN